jgi:transaldolase / glucose-6-phosphate isomerase
LIAESTGKHGRGMIPVDGEQVGAPGIYGDDRLFIYLRLNSGADPSQDAAVDALEHAAHPVVRIGVADIYDIGQEFFRWEMAVAIAGSIMGLNPFDQPDVEASKVATRALTAAFERTGALPTDSPIYQDFGISLYTDAGNADALEKGLGGDRSLAGYLRAHLNRLEEGDYFAILAYLAMNQTHADALQGMRHTVRDLKRVATCLGFGPRFLHSTGQLHKGGPNSGVFLQVTCDDATDIMVPSHKYSFGVVKAAEARGDFAVLVERERRALRVHLSADVTAGLNVLRAAVADACRPSTPPA